MTVKLAILKSGENIISDIKEAYYEDKLACYIFENPCKIVINGTYKILTEDEEDQDSNTNTLSISLHPWPSLSSDTSVQVVSDWIVTLVEPNSKLKEMYNSRVLQND